ncbi:MAG: DUF5053 domain-containing protein [Odoribacter splanchnicus]
MGNLDKYLPTPELMAEFEKFKALTPEERKQFQREREERLDKMSENEKQAYISASRQGLSGARKDAETLVEKAEELILKEKLGELPEIISLSYIARKYFGKSRNWLYQRINGYIVNGKPASFTPDERRKFSEALQDISDLIRKTSLSFS